MVIIDPHWGTVVFTMSTVFRLTFFTVRVMRHVIFALFPFNGVLTFSAYISSVLESFEKCHAHLVGNVFLTVLCTDVRRRHCTKRYLNGFNIACFARRALETLSVNINVFRVFFWI